MKKMIGILTGGGDVPGLNSAIKAFVHNAIEEGDKVIGIRKGWAGLLYYNINDPLSHKASIQKLDLETVRRIDRTGGTFLHTSRTNPQRVKAEAVPEFLKNHSCGKQIDENGTMDFTDHILNVLQHLKINMLVTIGGDDTLSYATRLYRENIPIVAIPKTMDNDVFGTDYCIGFSTAITRSVDIINNMRTSVGSHERIGVVELFGRNSGETSLISGYLTQVDRVIIPEVVCNVEKLAEFIVKDKKCNPSNYAMLTISEGAILEGCQVVECGEEDAYGHKKLGGVGMLLSEEIKRVTRQEIMCQQLGYLMRSGAPDSLDRMVAISFGHLAAQLIQRKEFGQMVAIRSGKYTTVPLEMTMAGTKTVDVEAYYDRDNYRPKIKDFMGVPMFLS